MKHNVKLDNGKERTTAKIHSLSHDGRGIAIIDNKTTFVSGALPSETVTYTITQKRSHYHEANTLEIIEPSSERVTPPCQHFGLCGGCSLQHMSMGTQMQLKQQTLLDQFKHFGHVSPDILISPLNAMTTGYRRKARLGVKYVIKKSKVLVGFREKSSRYLADLERCIVLHPRVGEHLHELGHLISTLESYRDIPQIEVAMGDDDLALIFRHLTPLSPADKEKLMAFAEAHRIHLYLQPNPPEPIYKLWPEDQKHRLTYTLPDHQVEFLFHPLDFTQINLEMNRLMVNQAIHFLDLQADDHVLDLFCGIGNFTLPIARHVKQVTGIEGSMEMVERANDNAQHNHLQNSDFYAANLTELSIQAPWIKSNYDKILLDPPRVGAKEMLPHFKHFAAKKIVYISCNPATLARDAGELVHQYGYRLKQAGIMNMFPHTSHIEAMAIFEKI
jgi:23S rRNA (uracil1939-C5)-methyltransferase